MSASNTNQPGSIVMAMTALSCLAHWGAWASLGFVPYVASAADVRSEVEIQVLPPEAEPVAVDEAEAEAEAEEPVPEPQTPEPRIEPAPRPEVSPAPPVEPPPEEAPAPEEEPLSFDGVVLTNEGTGASWSALPGSGRDRKGPLARPRAPSNTNASNPYGSREGQGVGKRGPTVVAVADLARRPQPPTDLDELLERNYPRQARQQGIEGEARVKIRINPDGSIRVLNMLSETWRGFGSACARTIGAAGSWRPPLNRSGNPVATIVPFRCRFEMRY